MTDLMQCLSAAFLRGSNVHALDTGITYAEQVSGMAEAAALLAEAAIEYRKARNKVQTVEGQPHGAAKRKVKAAKSAKRA